MNKMIDDTACIAAWKELIGTFNTLVDNNPPPEKIKKQLLDLKEKSKINGNLTYHQVNALNARCDNYLNGTYGNTKHSGVKMQGA